MATDWTGRIIGGLAYAWTAVLVVQNVGVLVAAGRGLISGGSGASEELALYIAFALATIAMLCLGVVAFKRWGNVYSTAFYALAILFAFPFGLYLKDRVLSSVHDLTPMTTASAICSYAAAGLVVGGYLRRRGSTARSAPAGALD